MKTTLSLRVLPWSQTLITRHWLVWLLFYWFQTGMSSGPARASGTDCLACDWLINVNTLPQFNSDSTKQAQRAHCWILLNLPTAYLFIFFTVTQLQKLVIAGLWVTSYPLLLFIKENNGGSYNWFQLGWVAGSKYWCNMWRLQHNNEVNR